MRSESSVEEAIRLALTPTLARMVTKISISPNGCWEWTGSRSNGGYGRMSMGRVAGVNYSHRLMYQELVGPIPPGHVLDHLCLNRACCRPSHLEPVTPSENTLRSNAPHVRLHHAGHCQRGHPRNQKTTVFRKGTHRVVYCKVCRRENRAAARALDGTRPQ